jgi:cobalt-zinc-cadmium efflux system membrane fusion protein
VIVTSGRVKVDDMLMGHVLSPVSGRVVQIVAALGDRVKAGAPLAVIESPDVGSAKSDVQKAKADMVAAEHDFERQKALREQHAASEAVLEQSQDNWRKARAELERAVLKTSLWRSGVAEGASERYTLLSPVDGELLARNVSPGAEVQGQYGGGASQELFTVGKLESLWVVGDVYESDLGKVHVGSPVAITVIAMPGRIYETSVDWVSGMLDPDTRTAKVRCRLNNSDRSLRPEMFATLQISVGSRLALAIPRPAVLTLGEHRVVFVQQEPQGGSARFSRVPVDVDASGSGPWVEVRHGLEPDQQVVVEGTELLASLF